MRKRIKTSLLCFLGLAVTCVSVSAAPLSFSGSSSQGTYSGTAIYSDNIVTITCTANPAATNILIYPNPPGGGYYMSNNSGQFTHTLSGLSAGTTLTFYFVIQNPNQWPVTEIYTWVISPGNATNPPGANYGDVNGDGTVTIVDALMTAQYFVGLRPASFITQAADVNLDGNISIVDALVIAQYYVGLISKLPIGATNPPTASPTATRTQTSGVTPITQTPVPTVTIRPTSTPVQTGGSWRVVWEDIFDGSGQPDSSNWNYNVGNGYNTGSGGFDGWGNAEWEWYRPQNAYQEGGNLVIKAEYNASPTSIRGRDWYQFSSRLTTHGKRAWQYGRMEARIAMPGAAGTWPAFWMMGNSCDASNTGSYNPGTSYYDTMATNWSSCGEVDIMEHRNMESVITQNLFWDSRTGVYAWQDGSNNSNASENIPVGDIKQFHLYTVEWDASELRWYVDRESNPNPTKRVSITASNQEEFHKPFFLMLNLAIQGRFTGPTDPDRNDFPLYMYVDYVRVWQQN